MQHNFPEAVHILITRNPSAQFDSARRQLVYHGNPYFLAMPLLILAMNRDLPRVRACLQHLRVTLPRLAGCHTWEMCVEACVASVRQSQPVQWYRGSLAFWLLGATSAPDSIDLLIDSELLAFSGLYRRQCAAELEVLTGRVVDFDDADGSRGVTVSDGFRPSPSEILLTNRAAEEFLIDQAGSGWADRPVPASMSRMITEASLGAHDRETIRQESQCGHVTTRSATADLEAMLRVTIRRAMQAEQALARVTSSRSWKLTAPLRSLRARFP